MGGVLTFSKTGVYNGSNFATSWSNPATGQRVPLGPGERYTYTQVDRDYQIAYSKATDAGSILGVNPDQLKAIAGVATVFGVGAAAGVLAGVGQAESSQAVAKLNKDTAAAAAARAAAARARNVIPSSSASTASADTLRDTFGTAADGAPSPRNSYYNPLTGARIDISANAPVPAGFLRLGAPAADPRDQQGAAPSTTPPGSSGGSSVLLYIVLAAAAFFAFGGAHG